MTQDTLANLIVVMCIVVVIALIATLAPKWRASKYHAPIVSDDPITKYDALPPGEAVAYAWSDADQNPHLHEMRKDELRAQMPLLARALDRLVEE